jgi:hypothetical protein
VVAQDHRLTLIFDPTLAYDADLERRAPHVGGDDVVHAQPFTQASGADEAADRA